MPKLIIFDESLRGVDLARSLMVIGRSKKCDIPIRDPILSRKHCAILPFDSTYRLMDLGSANGTYLNGRRIDSVELAYDDIIEIGNTVMVFMDAQVWQRGEGIAQLRNPVKAQKLIHRLSVQKGQTPAIPMEKIALKKSAVKNLAILKRLPGIEAWLDSKVLAGESEELVINWLTDYAAYKVTSILVRSRPKLKKLLSGLVKESVLELLSGKIQDIKPQLRTKIRKLIQELLDQAKESRHQPPGSEAGGSKGSGSSSGKPDRHASAAMAAPIEESGPDLESADLRHPASAPAPDNAAGSIQEASETSARPGEGSSPPTQG